MWPSSWIATAARAKQRHLPRVEGHRNGVESVRAVVRAAGEAGVKYLTLYAFSVENWNRPKDEVDTLMRYLARFLKGEIGELNKNNVRLEAIGQIYRLPEFVQEQLRKKTKSALARNTGLTLILALSYGGRTEFGRSCPRHRPENKGRRTGARRNQRAVDLGESLHPALSGSGSSCSDERRNAHQQFSALADFVCRAVVVTPTLWPDFRRAQFFEALEEYTRRHRRFGLV